MVQQPDLPAEDLTSIHARAAVRGEHESLAWIAERFDPFLEAQVRMRLGTSGARHDLVRDVVNHVWLVFLQKAATLRSREGHYAPVIAKFLSTVALHECNNAMRRLLRERARGDGAADDTSSAGQDPLDLQARDSLGVVTRAVQGELHARIEDALESMGERQRELILLRLFEQRSNVEIADSLGLKANTVAVQYRRALEALRRVLPPSFRRELTGARPSRS